ncbi:MAG: CBS domain-containing protein [bacterium]|nr:CBS domain-containing protein [bacterium]
MNIQKKIIQSIIDQSRKAAFLVDKAKMTEHSFTIIVALLIGALAGGGALLIRIMIKAISDLAFAGNGTLLDNIIAAPWYIKVFVPAIGGLIVGPLIYFFAREAKGHGVPEVMQSILLRGGVIRPRVAAVKAIASAVTIGTGGAVGREGPIVQIGSSIGSAVGQFFRVSNVRMKTFVGCGAAAGIAAAFNAPIAGALFAVEIILQDFAVSQFSPIVVSSVMATVISHKFEGDLAAFKIVNSGTQLEGTISQLKSPVELVFFFILACVCGLVGYAFIKVLYFSEDFFDDKFRFPEYLKPVIGGLLIGSIALVFPQIMGVGYDSISAALVNDPLWSNELIWYIPLVLMLVKIVASSLTLGSGGSGGIFAPSLFIGSMGGIFFGRIVHKIFPNVTSTPETYAVVAMGGLIAATTYAPITAIIMVFELTKNTHIILPVMMTCIISTIIASKLSRESIYTLKLVRRNIHMKDGAEANIMKSIFVKDVYTKTYETIDSTNRFNEVANQVIAGHDPYFPMVNKKGQLEGMISLHDIKEHLYDKDILQDLLIAEDIANKSVESVKLEDNCHEVIEKLREAKLQGLPVVSSKKSGKLLGMVWRKDILDSYNREVERRDITSSYASKITMKNIDSDVHFMEGYALTEIPVPKTFVGKSIKDLNIRAEFGVDVLLIRNNTEQGSKIKAMPSPVYVFSYDDSIVISGEIGKINLLKAI